MGELGNVDIRRGIRYWEEEITRQEFDALTTRVSSLEKLTAVADNELKHIRDDIAWIKRGITTIVGLMGTAVVGALLKLVLKV